MARPSRASATKSASSSSRTTISSTSASPIGTRCRVAAASGPGPRWCSSTSPRAAARPSSSRPESRSRRARGNLLTWNNLDAHRRAQSLLHAFGLPGYCRRQICDHQMVSRATLVLHGHTDLLIRRGALRLAQKLAVRPSCGIADTVLPYYSGPTPIRGILPMNRAALLAAASLLITVLPLSAASAQAPTATAQGATPAQQNAGERLHQLFHDSDEASLRRNPISAMFRGDFRYADHLGDYISDAYFAAEQAAVEQDLATLASIDRSTLNADRPARLRRLQVSSAKTILIDYQPDMLALTVVRPLNHFSGFHTFYPVFASGRNAAPFRNVEDYENNLRRHREFVDHRRSRDRALPPGPGIGRGRDQAHDPERHRPARHPAERRARGLALLRAGPELPRRGAGSGARAAARRPISRWSATASSRPTAGCAISCATNICPTPATASASSTCAAATSSTGG